MMETSSVLSIALLFFVGLTVTSKSGWDRLIYGSFAVATLAALIYYHQIPFLSGRRF